MAAATGVRRTLPVRRRYLISLSVMGALVCALGSTGLFAALTDSALTGQNTVDSAALAGAAELKIQKGTLVPSPLAGVDEIVCDPMGWVDDLTTGGFTAVNVGPGFDTANQYYCLQNTGTGILNLAATVDSLIDVEIGCTGDEELAGDTTCGGMGDGELSDVLEVRYVQVECFNTNISTATTIGLGNASNPVQLGLMPSGAIRCFGLAAFYPSGTLAEWVQRAQSDHSQWRFKFSAVAT